MKKLLVLFGLMFVIFACSNDCLNMVNECFNGNFSEKNNNENNQGNSNTEDPGKRPTTLQDVVNDTNAGEEIDLSQYKDLTDYSATIDKKLTIKNGSLNNAKLQITGENVKLEKIEKVSVSTSSRLTITNSKLSDLLIGGSGETSRSTTSDLETSLAMVSVTGCEIADIQLKGFNSQLNITDTATKIADILTSTKSKIILEAGSYDGMKDPVVEDNGELTRIDMTKDKELSVLSIYSNPKKAEYKLNEEIDLTGLIVMGTYTASVEIFKSGGWKGEAIESVTKWEDEKDYSVSYNFGTAGVQIVTIKSKSADVECNFYVYVVDDSQNDETSKPEKEEIKVTDVKVKILGTPKTSYKVGEKLDLSCYQVVGTYSGFEINLPYTSDPANGTVLSEAGENIEIKFYYNDKMVETKQITVRRPCTVEFYDGIDSSKLVCKTEVAFGESLKLPVAPSKTGYTFDVWVDDVKNKVTSEKNVEEDLKLYATWTANTYTVKFDSNGGNGTMDSPTFTYDKEEPLTANAFTRTGYTFAGWAESAGGNVVYTDKESVKNLKSENNATITLYAQWTANTYTVKFNANGGSGTMTDKTFTYDVEQALTANAFTRKDYTFAGWAVKADGDVTYTDMGKVKNLTAEDKATVTLYAVWTEKDKVLPVVFSLPDETALDYNDSVTLSCKTEEAKISYTIDGVTTEYSNAIVITKNVTITAFATKDGMKDSDKSTASYTVKTYTVTYKSDYDTAPSDVAGLKKGDKLTAEQLPKLTTAGYTFAGWFNGETKIEAGYTITCDLELTAKWNANTDTAYTVEHYQQNIDDDKYTLVNADTENKTGTTGEDTSATAKDYTGFTAKPIEQMKISANGSTVVKIYYDRNTITLTLDLDGGEGTESITGKYGATVNVRVPTKNGYTFAGWNLDLPATLPAGNAEYTATWTADTYTITYNLYEGENNTANPRSYNIETSTITLFSPTKTGYTFGGWYTDSNFSTDKKVTEITKGSTGNITLYAKWTANKSEIKITLPESNDPEINLQQEMNGNKVTFSANGGFKSYAWYIDGEKQVDVTGETFELNTSSMDAANYSVMVIVKDSSKVYYSATAVLELKK